MLRDVELESDAHAVYPSYASDCPFAYIIPGNTMAFETGARLGHYQILAPAGAGGMGEVYKATDPRLNRTVALKVLPPHIADKAESRQRFEREAQAIAALNHPHICVIHDVGQHEGIAFIVMEYIEGETLASRIARGPIPFDQLLTYGIQIADALDKAHRRGVVHRDLKPGNIMLARTGVKLLDFGLAKFQPVVSASDSAQTVATLSKTLTAGGVIMGTLQYMSPEQLEGKEADERSDIFAFGAVLYEMATGRPAFEGKSAVSLMAAILERDPTPVTALQPVAPPLFDDVIRICLAKNPEDRWQSAADLLHELKLLVRYGTLPVITPKISRRREVIPWSIAALSLIVLVAMIAAFAMRSTPVPEKVLFEQETPPAGSGFELSMIAVSPDGSRLVYLAPEKGSLRRMWLRNMDQTDAVVLAGVENPIFPFWSPDGRSVGYFANGELMRVDIAGGPPSVVAPASSGRGGTWNRDNVIVFAATAAGPLFRVSAAGGVPTQLTELSKEREELAHKHPWFLPDGNHFLYLVLSQKAEYSGIYVGSLDSRDTTRLLPSATNAQFAPPDRLLFMRDNTLMVQRFDLVERKLKGEPLRVAEGVSIIGGTGNGSGFGVSQNGRLAYRPGGNVDNSSLFWIDRTSGKPLQSIGPPANWSNPKVSPDGKRLAVFKREAGGGDIWIFDLEHIGDPSRFTFDAGEDNYPIWSHDGSRIIFASNRNGGVFNLYQKSANGIGEEVLLLKNANNKYPTHVSSDGIQLLYDESDPKNLIDIWLLSLSGDPRPTLLHQTALIEQRASFSPDKRWIAYESNESANTFQVYVRDFPLSGGKYQISLSGATRPTWSRDGNQLFYIGLAGQLSVVDLTGTTPGGEFRWSNPRLIMTGVAGGAGMRNNFDIPKGDKNRLLVVSSLNENQGTPPIVVVLNWETGLFQ